MNELISVIVPVYNVQNYLRTCIDSIIGQSYKNLEILLIDDGSTDSSGDICDELKQIDDRITVYHKENGGLSDARNYGLDHSHGSFYAFIDSDDALHKDFFSELMQAQKEHDADIVSCNMTLFYDQSELPELFKLQHVVQKKVFLEDSGLKEYLSPQSNRTLFNHGLCMKIYKKSLFENLRFEKGRLHEDMYITYLLFDISKKVVHLDCPYYFYFQSNDGSICKNYGVKNFLDEFEAYQRMRNYFSGNKKISNELTRFLIIQYLLMLENGYKIRKSPEIQKQLQEIKHWINDNVDNCPYYSKIKKCLIHLSTREIRVYSFMKKIRGR